MFDKKALIAALAATSVVAAGAAYAADHSAAPPSGLSPQMQTAATDAGKLSADGSRAYQTLALTRLAIFDGRIDDAKKFISEADTDFAKAKTDQTVFTKAEADLKAPAGDKADAKAADADASKSDMKKPVAWLPVDGEMSVNEDYTANPQKAAAVADANKSIAKGDSKGAVETLKLANVDVDYVIAVVPLKQTLSDVHAAADQINAGKYYEASQTLRQVQDSTRYDLLDLVGVPKTGAAKDKPAATH